MPDFNVRSDSVNVEAIMEQIRARIREKRGVDYTEQQIRELAAVKLEKFLDPRSVRSDLLNEFRRGEPDPNYAFEDDTLFKSTRGVVGLIRRLLRPLLKLFFNPNPLIHVLHMQSQINDLIASRHLLSYELIHNLVVETRRLGIEVKNLKMRVESLDARVDFNERRARALEGAVLYRPQHDEREEGRVAPAAHTDRVASRPPPPSVAPAMPAPRAGAPGAGGGPGAPGGPVPGPAQADGPGQRSKRRRRRRGRRGGAPAATVMGAPPGSPDSFSPSTPPDAPAGGGSDPEPQDGPDDSTGHDDEP
jgi:hypothetical protein